MKWTVTPPKPGRARAYALLARSKVQEAAARATDKAALGARDELRAAMRAQRLGNLANAIGSTSDLKKRRVGIGVRGGFNVAGFVTASIRSERTAGALQAYVDNDQTNIAPVRGRWLWIATQEIPQRAGRRRMTPQLYIEKGFDKRIGPLVFVKAKRPGEAFLVVPDTTVQIARPGKPKRLPKSGRPSKGRGRVGLIAFIGIRRTRRSRRVAPRDIAANWQRRLPNLLAAELAGKRL